MQEFWIQSQGVRKDACGFQEKDRNARSDGVIYEYGISQTGMLCGTAGQPMRRLCDQVSQQQQQCAETASVPALRRVQPERSLCLPGPAQYALLIRRPLFSPLRQPMLTICGTMQQYIGLLLSGPARALF